MTSFKDNIGSGNIATTSANSSLGWAELTKTYFVSAGAGVNVTIPGVFPPNTQNITAAVYVVQQGAATTNDNINLYVNGSAANGQKILTFSAIGSAAVRLAPTSYITSAAANPPVPAQSNNGGEIPFKAIVSSVSTASYQIKIIYNRADTIWGPQGPYQANTFV